MINWIAGSVNAADMPTNLVSGSSSGFQEFFQYKENSLFDPTPLDICFAQDPESYFFVLVQNDY